MRRAAAPTARRRAPRWAGALALVAWAAGATAALAAPGGEAVVIGAVTAAPVWVEVAGPPRGGAPPQAAVLEADGGAWWVGPGGPLRVAGGLPGEQLTRCGDALLAVGARGTLTRFAPAPDLGMATVAGPPVSLLHRPLCLDGAAAEGSDLPGGAVVAVDPEGELVVVSADLRVLARSQGARALPDAEPAALHVGGGAWAVAVLADPTQRYRSGLLGDEVEAGSVVLLALPALDELARWHAPPPAVIEERRALPWHAGGSAGIHLIVSSEGAGTRLVTLVVEAGTLRPLAEGRPLEQEAGWLHLFAAPGARAYAQHDPHGAGPVVRYAFEHLLPAAGRPGTGAAHRRTRSALDVAGHVLGERNLDRAVWMLELAGGDDLLAMPGGDLRAVAWLRCDASRCRLAATSRLPAALATNLARVVEDGEALGLLAADVTGHVWWLPVPAQVGR